jgi:site-specific recombinase XerC
MEDLVLSEAHLRVWGKGRKQRVLPLTADTLQVLQKLSPLRFARRTCCADAHQVLENLRPVFLQAAPPP